MDPTRKSDADEPQAASPSGDPGAAQAPGPGAFPLHWDDPADAQALWAFDAVHTREQMTPLDFGVRICPMVHGSNQGNEYYGVPFRSEPRLINTFVYQKFGFAAGPGEDFEAVMKAAEAAVRRAAAELGSRWEGTWLPEIQARLAEARAFDLGGADLPELLAHLDETRRRVERLWEVHFQLLIPMVVAISDFEEAYRGLFPEAGPFAAYDLLAGFPNKTVESNLRLWELGREVARAPALRALFESTALAELPGALAASPEGSGLWSKLVAYLEVYGERNDNLYLDSPTWLEDPTPVLRSLRESLAHPEKDLPQELAAQAARRESRLAEARAQLASHPRAVLEEFEALLKAAQVATALSEDHNFWLDNKITTIARRVCVEVGRRLRDLGVIEASEDVFYLTVDELSPEGDPAASAVRLRASIAERRAEASRFAATNPPPVLGAMPQLPPLDNALMRASFKLTGAAAGPPQGESELRGMPGSAGRVTGRARVVRTLADSGKLEPGDVLVASTTLPTWTPFFSSVAAVVTDAGGILSHAAVVAREYGIPAVVGTRTATEALRDGQLVEVDGDAGVVRVLER